MHPAATALAVLLALLRVGPSLAGWRALGGWGLGGPLRGVVMLTLAVGMAPVATAVPLPVTPGGIVLACVQALAVGVTLALVLATPWVALGILGSALDGVRGTAVNGPETVDGPTPGGGVSGMLRVTGAMVFVTAGGPRGVLLALGASFTAVPPGATVTTERLVALASRWTAQGLAGALTVGSAGWLALVAAEMVLAGVARLAPSVDRAGLALPVRVLVPLGVIAAAAGLWTQATQGLWARTLEVVRGVT